MDPYKVLGLENGPECSPAEIKKVRRRCMSPPHHLTPPQAFKLLALKLHPDKNRDDPDAGAHELWHCAATHPHTASKFNRLQTAYEALNDEAAKAAVDALYKCEYVHIIDRVTRLTTGRVQLPQNGRPPAAKSGARWWMSCSDVRQRRSLRWQRSSEPRPVLRRNWRACDNRLLHGPRHSMRYATTIVCMSINAHTSRCQLQASKPPPAAAEEPVPATVAPDILTPGVRAQMARTLKVTWAMEVRVTMGTWRPDLKHRARRGTMLHDCAACLGRLGLWRTWYSRTAAERKRGARWW